MDAQGLIEELVLLTLAWTISSWLASITNIEMNRKNFEAIVFYAILVFIAIILAILMGPTTSTEIECCNSREYLEQEIRDNNYR